MDRKTRKKYLGLIKQARKLALASDEVGEAEALAAIVDAHRPVPNGTDPRVLARRMGSFTITEFEEAVGRSRPTVIAIINRLVDQGVIEDSGLRRKHDGPGRPAVVYQAVAINARLHERKKRLPPEVEVRHTFTKMPVVGTGPSGRKPRLANSEVRKLVGIAKSNGCRVQMTANHIKVFAPNGRIVLLPSTPSDHRALLNVRSELRKAGIPV